MKTNLLIILGLISISLNAQVIKENKVAIISNLVAQEKNTADKDVDTIIDYCHTASGILSCSYLSKISKVDNLPFKIYDVPTANLNIQQDIYNSIISHVPGVQISNNNLIFNETPTITMRGDTNTVYIIDGQRFYDASILNTINPNDIESIKVTTDIAASNYLLINRN